MDILEAMKQMDERREKDLEGFKEQADRIINHLKADLEEHEESVPDPMEEARLWMDMVRELDLVYKEFGAGAHIYFNHKGEKCLFATFEDHTDAEGFLAFQQWLRARQSAMDKSDAILKIQQGLYKRRKEALK